MNRPTFVLACLLFLGLNFQIALSQDASSKVAEREKSNLEKFSLRSGTLVEKNFTDLGVIKTIQVQSLRVTDLLTKASFSGIRFEQATSNRYRSANITFLDQDEIDGLAKSIRYILDTVMSSRKPGYTEIQFTSRGGFALGCYSEAKGWQPYIQISKYDKESMLTLFSSDLNELLLLLDKTKSK